MELTDSIDPYPGLTAFPNLYSSTTASEQHTSKDQTSVSCDLDVTLQTLRIAWAYFLRAYTNVENPIFLEDNEIIQVNCSTGQLWKPNNAHHNPKDSRGTGFWTNKVVSSNSLALHLHYNPENGMGKLSSCGSVPFLFMKSIARQLRQFIYQKKNSLKKPLFLPLIDGSDCHSLLSIVNASPSVISGPSLLHELLLQNFNPERLAIDFLHESGAQHQISYKSLANLSTDLAVHLQSLIPRGGSKIIPILIPQSPQLYSTILAVLKTGAAFCPLDLDAPVERLSFVLKDTSASVILTTSLFKQKLTHLGHLKLIAIDELSLHSSGHLHVAPSLRRPKPSDLAYVIYTSGSSGTPKGVCISHFAITQSLLAHDEHIPLFTRFLQFAGPTFDVFVFEVFFPLLRGATIVGRDRSQLLNNLPDTINRLGVDAVELTPTVAGALLGSRDSVPELKLLLTIGEMLTRQVVDNFGTNSTNRGILHGLYGPTETAVHCTIASNFRSDFRVGNIGVPLSTVCTMVIANSESEETVDANITILPIGQIGELAISGPQLAQFYLNRPEQTAAAFVNTQENGRIYKTGDRARLLPDGSLECLGRISKGQLKLRGQRVELGEVEHVACKTPGLLHVSASVVNGNIILFCLANQNSITPKDIFDLCQSWLPSYMIPGDVIILMELPRLPSGKTDKRRLESDYERAKFLLLNVAEELWAKEERSVREMLQQIACNQSVITDGHSIPHQWSRVELQIRDLLSKLSGTPSKAISPDSTIYQLGMDSIDAIHLSAQLREMDYLLNAVDVLERPSIRQLAQYVESSSYLAKTNHQCYDFSIFELAHRESISSKLSAISWNIKSILPCTPVQSGMLARFLHSQGREYLNHIVLKFTSNLDIPRLKRAWKDVLVAHDMLRAVFVETDDSKYPFAMAIYRDDEIESHFIEIPSNLASLNSLLVLRRQLVVDIIRDFRLPPWRLSVVKLGQDTLVQLSAHHALYDAESLQIIFSDLSKRCNNLPISPAKRLEPALMEILTSSEKNPDAQREFWQDIGKQIVVNRFPCLTPLRVLSEINLVCSRTLSKPLGWLQQGCKSLGIPRDFWDRISSVFLTAVAFPCIVTLPTYCTLQGSNSDLLQRLVEWNSKVIKHQFTPLKDIQRFIGNPEHGLFDVLFAYQKHDVKESGIQFPYEVLSEETTVNVYPIPPPCLLWALTCGQYAISFELIPTNEDSLEIQITFREDLVPREQVELMISQYDMLLVNTVMCPDSSCSETNEISAELLSITPAKDHTIYSEATLLHQFVELRSQVSPKTIALEFATAVHPNITQHWTYDQLNNEGNSVAHALMSYGVVPGQLIAICFQKCPQAYFAILGILKSGCAFVAIDPTSPIARIQYILDDSRSKLLLTMESHSTSLVGHVKIPTLFLDETTTCKADRPLGEPELAREVNSSDICYCLYTSGTTGNPKGCEITHENAVQAIMAFQRLFEGHWDKNSKFLQFASFHFDVSVLEQFWSWSVGICVTSVPRDIIFEDIATTIRSLGITHIDLTPSLAKLLHPDEVPSLCKGIFITGGEQLRQDILDLWGPKGVIYNGYGPTEATIGVTMYPRVPSSGKPSNIGLQFDNVGTFVFSPNTEFPVLRGAVGELCVYGKLVGRGYLNRPELTKNKFPFIEKFRERVYRTGDLVRILHDGTFDFIGRIDDQIKLRGQRIEIGEINEVIRQGPGNVQEVTTFVLKHSKQVNEQLVAFIVFGSELDSEKKEISVIPAIGNNSMADIRNFCRSRLPPYMIPTHFIPLRAFPLSANNKADAQELRKIFNSLSLEDLLNLSAAVKSPDHGWTEKELPIVHGLAKITRLELESISRSSNIFELGLDSISVISFVRYLRNNGFTHVKTSTILSNPTVGKIVNLLQEASKLDSPANSANMAAVQAIAAFAHKHASAIARDLGVSSDSIESIAPCTPLQAGMISRSLASNKQLYFGAFYYQLSNNTEITRLKSAWLKVISGCQILRTNFVLTADGYAQAITMGPHDFWRQISTSSEEEVRIQKANCFLDWWQRTRELASVPFEILILEHHPAPLMCLHIFHALYDGNSLTMILNRLWMEYHHMTRIDYGPPFHSALPYGPLCNVEGSKEFWIRQTSDISSAFFPLAENSTGNDDISETLKIEAIPGLEEVRRKLQTTHQALIQACWTSALQNQLKRPVRFGIITSGRSNEFYEVEKVIGPLFNTIPFLMIIGPYESWKSVVERCHSFNVAALPYQHTPLRDIIRWSGSRSDQPLFESLFAFQKEPENISANSSHCLWTAAESKSLLDYPLAFEAFQRLNGSFELQIITHGQVFSSDTVQQLLEQTKTALFRLIEDPASLVLGPKALARTNAASSMDHSVSERELSLEKAVNTTQDFIWCSTSKHIREIIATVANVQSADISHDTSILEIGLDSIDAIKLSYRLKQSSIHLSVSGIMQNSTIRKMMQKLDEKPASNLKSTEDSSLDAYEKQLCQNLPICDSIETILPATPIQEAMVSEMLSSNFSRYYNHAVLKIKDNVDLEQLCSAWDTVIASSPILRTSFVEIEDPSLPFSYAQVVHKSSTSHWRRLQGEENVDLSVEGLVRIASRFNNVECLLGLTLVEGRFLIFSIAHALYDGQSLQSIHLDVHNAYHGSFLARRSYRPALQEILNSSRNASTSFWRRFVSGTIPSILLPRLDAEQPSLTKINRQEKHSQLTTNDIKSFCKSHGITIQTLGQTCWAVLLALRVQSHDVVFGTVLSGRKINNTEDIMFPTMNTVATRIFLHGSRLKTLHYVQETMNQIMEYKHFPLRQALSLAQLGDQAAFNSLFIYQKSSVDDTRPDLSLYDFVGGTADVEYPVCVEMETVEDAIIWRTACYDSFLDSYETGMLLDQIDSILLEILRFPEKDAIKCTKEGVSICHFEGHFNPNFSSVISTPKEDLCGGGLETGETWSRVEEKIRQAISKISKVATKYISKRSSIYNLGLDSISTIKLASLLRKEALYLNVTQILSAGTVEQMALVISKNPPENISLLASRKDAMSHFFERVTVDKLLNEAGIFREDLESLLPASSGQIYLLTHWQNSKGATFYPEFKYVIQTKAGREHLESAWKVLLHACPILRTTFLATKDLDFPFVQLVWKAANSSVTWLSDAPALSVSPSSPLVRLSVYETATLTALKLDIHHALYDAVSLSLLITHFQSLLNNPSHPISQPILSFVDFLAPSCLLTTRARNKVFWQSYLLPQSPLFSPCSTTYSTKRHSYYHPSLLSTPPLMALARTCNLSLHSIAIACIVGSLCNLIQRRSLTLGIYLANRATASTFPTLTFLPLQVALQPSAPLLQLAANVQRDIARVREHEASLSQIKEWTGVKVDVFVNFVPAEGVAGTTGVTAIENLDSASDLAAEMAKLARPANAREWVEPVWIKDNPVRDAYIPTVDIEVAVRNGMLDVGVFGPADMLPESMAKGLVNSLRELLLELVDVEK
ncbi:MAG: NRPS [Trizodia sp. TS-e1964]|nr:MAG: NRPS [Trizodia sp. TS-e1964]